MVGGCALLWWAELPTFLLAKKIKKTEKQKYKYLAQFLLSLAKEGKSVLTYEHANATAGVAGKKPGPKLRQDLSST